MFERLRPIAPEVVERIEGRVEDAQLGEPPDVDYLVEESEWEWPFNPDNADLPGDIAARFGVKIVGDSPAWSGAYEGIDAAREAEVVAELRRRGYRVRRDDAAIASAFWG